MNLTYTWGDPMNPIPMDKRPNTEAKLNKLNPPAPHTFINPGSISFNPLITESVSFKDKKIAGGNINKPKNIRAP